MISFLRVSGVPQKGESPTPLTRKKEITMTKSRHNDTVAGTDSGTGTGTGTGTDTGIDTDTDTAAATGAATDAGTAAATDAANAPLVLRSRAES